MRSDQDWIVARSLKMVPGVADVVSFGGFIKQYQVNLDAARMKSYGISVQQVFNAIGRGNANAGGSFPEQGEQQYLIRGIGLLRSSDDIGNVVVAARNGTPLLIRDIADISIGSAQLRRSIRRYFQSRPFRRWNRSQTYPCRRREGPKTDFREKSRHPKE